MSELSFGEGLDTLTTLGNRFRGFLPVVVDVETGGFNAREHALLEIAAVTLDMTEDGQLVRRETIAAAVIPHPDLAIEQAALDFTGINPADPNRQALPEKEALNHIFHKVRECVRENDCTRAVIVAHNAHFDLGFVNAASERAGIKRNPFHPFSCFDTATLAGLAFGQTVLARACAAAGIPFSNREAHSAAYDAEKTAELFCQIVNRWKDLGGWR
ncbi:MAG: ribonuclease T [Porticoccaceae bacterium]|jgi:ribonuclease T|nr:ribonuclease T [Porticoccaceae bacterium]MEA3301116.1 ribonuclease T [Pseudomonadota bacterium]HLS98136.1 ribonuclease T [Porticoccaceae bacterium]